MPRDRSGAWQTGIFRSGLEASDVNRLQAPDYKRMVEKLRLARQEAGLTQVEVAERLGQPQPYVSKIERGERRIDPPELARFAAVYGKDVR
jgi:ribosome-binding protein aMBF1 (putative translation factor)